MAIYVYMYLICAINKDAIHFVTNCLYNTVWGFSQREMYEKSNDRLYTFVCTYICMYVRAFVTECPQTTAKQSVCLNDIKQSRDRIADSDKTAITSGSPKCLWGRQQICHP